MRGVMPSGVFKPYAGVSTAILFFTKTTGGTDNVWFYDMQSDGFSLDDKRTAQDKSDLHILARWQNLRENQRERARNKVSYPRMRLQATITICLSTVIKRLNTKRLKRKCRWSL